MAIPDDETALQTQEAMELGHYQLQTFVTSAVIFGTAGVALICDYLRRNNEQLRELTIELKIRHEEEQRRSHQLTPRPAEQPPKIENIAAPKERTAVGNQRKRTPNCNALAAMERGAALAGAGGRPRSPAPAAPAQPKPTVAKKDWGLLLSRSAHKPEAAPPSLPVGFHDGFVLKSLVQSRQPVSGLVVSIGVKASGTLPQSVHQLVQSLISPNDFATQSKDDEFLLIYPQERGASAQRRLSQIAQQLWDFQLRSIGSLQILFSWGGVEVRSASIEEAIASANERMQETKRSRNLLTMWSPAPTPGGRLRQAG
jgi:hypothetical protein